MVLTMSTLSGWFADIDAVSVGQEQECAVMKAMWKVVLLPGSARSGMRVVALALNGLMIKHLVVDCLLFVVITTLIPRDHLSLSLSPPTEVTCWR